MKSEINRVMNETGPYYLTNIIKKTEEPHKILIGKYFFPFPGGRRNEIKNLTKDDLEFVKNFINEDTYCIHLHTTTWQ
jgi:hypothetical protein